MITTFTSAELMLQSKLIELDQMINTKKSKRDELISQRHNLSQSADDYQKQLADLDDRIGEIDADIFDIMYERREYGSVYARMITYNKSQQKVENLINLFY